MGRRLGDLGWTWGLWCVSCRTLGRGVAFLLQVYNYKMIWHCNDGAMREGIEELHNDVGV
jgi:hypothetical protein